MSDLTLERIFSDPDLSGSAPIALKFSPDGSRVSFLKPSSADFEQLDLWEYHIADRQARLLVDAASLSDSDRALSTEEKARRERKRMFQTGIVEYFW